MPPIHGIQLFDYRRFAETLRDEVRADTEGQLGWRAAALVLAMLWRVGDAPDRLDVVLDVVAAAGRATGEAHDDRLAEGGSRPARGQRPSARSRHRPMCRVDLPLSGSRPAPVLMLLGIDWSGDPGMKLGTSSQCVMAVAVCADGAALAGALAQLRRDRGLPKDFEFHYIRLNESLRVAFMDVLADQPIRATVAIYEKDRMQPRWAWGRNIDLLVALIVHCAPVLPTGSLDGAKMLIDGDREAKALIRVLRPALSQALGEHGISDRLDKMQITPEMEKPTK